ncbi:hypothetical protein [Sinorhizobium sp. BG8]|uniref:hypothetical protein n=1 Tax=Sinorhizobium sp. BG8 TaxID=2613773 RepID=UPI00193E6A02|nr:hypothetical protein [Sinorhizobium sp. BG8]QRM56633.1 hypothetical protein F3Y30_20410 [Sinorhizobium sp. BG8]
MTAMRFFVLPVVSLFLLAGPVLAEDLAAAPSDNASAEQAATSLTTPAERLNSLFVELKRENDPNEARDIAERIRLEWLDSGSATINLLMQWADKAMAENKNAIALDFLDEAILLAPGYVEGWNRRATLHFKMGNYRKSMADINQVLAIEPRHFGAIAGLAAILTSAGKDELALEAWQRFLDIYPSERQAQEQLGELAEKLAGKRT